MIDASEIQQIVTDPRLTSDAARLVTYVRLLGPGEHEIDVHDLRALLGCRSNKPIIAARELAIKRGYLRFREGGRGHSNRYEYVASQGDLSVDRTPHKATYTPVVVEEEVEDKPPIPLSPVAPDAEAAIEQHAELLAGCRGALRDYLRKRVAPPRQSGFVHDVASKINGLGFNWMGLPVEPRAGLVAAALNELSATDETGYKSPPGDPRNFRQKLNIMVQNTVQPPPQRATGTDGRPYQRRGKQPMDQQEYTPTNEFPGWQG